MQSYQLSYISVIKSGQALTTSRVATYRAATASRHREALPRISESYDQFMHVFSGPQFLIF